MSEDTRFAHRRRLWLAAGLAVLAGPAAAQCRRTPDTGAGPFLRGGQPAQADLCQRVPGKSLAVSGRVVAFPECNPVAGARIEVWHADARGVYSLVNAGPPDDLACLLRATLVSAEDGRYAFGTLLPGAYFSRPAHIHFRVTAAGYRTLDTRMALAPGEGIDSRLVARITSKDPDGTVSAEFDLALAPAFVPPAL